MGGQDHYGIDYESNQNNIVAAANGVIERSDVSDVYGEVIVIRHNDGSATLYALLSERRVNINDVVLQGDIIGIGGLTHLHFEYIPNGLIYATKQRINPGHCFPPVKPPTAPTSPFVGTTSMPSQSPLVPPNTHSPTPAPTLLTGSITVRDSGYQADDSFAVYVDVYRLCETEIGQLNTCAVNFLRPGLHTLTLEILVAPDGYGTYNVKLSDGWMFVDGTTSKDASQLNGFWPPEGWKGSWNFTVPFE